MFSFFRKNRTNKDLNTHSTIGGDHETAHKTKSKNDKKLTNCSKKIIQKAGEQSVTSHGGEQGISSDFIDKESFDNVSSKVEHTTEESFFPTTEIKKDTTEELESFDEFCEAYDTPHHNWFQINDSDRKEFLDACEEAQTFGPGVSNVECSKVCESAKPSQLTALYEKDPCASSDRSTVTETTKDSYSEDSSKEAIHKTNIELLSVEPSVVCNNLLVAAACDLRDFVGHTREQPQFLAMDIPIITISCDQSDDIMSESEQGHPSDSLQSMEEKIHRLEMELNEKDARLEELEAAVLADSDKLDQLEREEELRLLQEALEEALEEKAEIEAKMLRDASRESQLLDDFEWKLGEIEKEYKKKLIEMEKATEERVKKEMAAEYQQILGDKRDIDEKLAEITHLKSYEAEVTQLRGLIHEQQRAIRVAARQVDQLRNNERLLQDDLNKIRTQGYTRAQQLEMEEKWEKKTQSECNRLRSEMLAANEEEMLKTIRQVVREKDDQITALRRQHDSQQQALLQQISELKGELKNKASEFAKQLETARTAADRELWNLRRELNKTQDSHVELIEEMRRNHASELEKIKQAVVENKESIEKDFQDKLQSVELRHQNQMAALQSMTEEEKQEALTQLGEHYQGQLESLKDYTSELQKKIAELEKQKREETNSLKDLLKSQEDELTLLRQNLISANIQKGNEIETRSSSSSSSRSVSSDDDESTPPTGRSAGDGCSPSASAAASQDNLRPCLEQSRSISPKDMEYNIDVSLTSEEIPIKTLDDQIIDESERIMCCNDPEHLDAQQIILEMHQVLADRDAELQRLTEEKRFYQLELIHWERNLALHRAGLPLSLVPDRYITENDFNSWKGYSAPPITKPRLPECFPVAASAAYDAERPISYEMYSPSEVSLSPVPPNDKHSFSPEQLVADSSGFPFHFDTTKPFSALQLDRNFCFSDEDDDSNNNGFTTPL